MPSKKQRAKAKTKQKGQLLKAYGKSNNTELFVEVKTLFPKFPQWIISTTSNEIEELLEKMSNVPKNTLQYNKAMTMVNQYTDEQVTHFKSNNPQLFGNWSDDIVISYCIRVILFDLPIPIVPKPPQSLCQALFG